MKKFFELLFGKKEKDLIFYELFSESAKVCKDSAAVLLSILENGAGEENILNARQCKHKSNKILKKTFKYLNLSKNPPFDGNDIRNIASKLNKITKKIVKAGMNFKVYSMDKASEDMILQAKTLQLATEELVFTMSKFAENSDISDMTDRNLKMKEMETRGDEIHYNALAELFSGSFDPLTVIKYRDIYKDIENALDKCCDVSDMVMNTVYKIKWS